MAVDTLLKFIGKYESNNDPNAIWGGIKKADRPIKPLVKMTVGEVLAWQDSIDHKYMSEASGEWQFMEDTLRGIYNPAGVAISDKFDDATQVKLATYLLKRRGLDKYVSGSWSAERFALEVSKEWASMPIPYDHGGKRRGQSYYAGDGLNMAHADVDEFIAAIRSVKDAEPVAEVASKGGGFVSLLAGIIKAIFGSKK